MREVTEEVLRILSEGGSAALATVIRTSGSTPQRSGARLLLHANGEITGTVGGGAIEDVVLGALRRCVRDGKPVVISHDLGRDLGMCCGGRMEVFVERIESEPRLIVFGAGHVARPTAVMARSVGFRVVIVDDREELNTEERFPGCERLLAEPCDAAEALCVTGEDWLLIVTHDHRLDEEALDHYARIDHRYLGMIGSRRKVFRILQRINARRDLPPLDRVYAPVGVALGAVSPEEIGVSIIAELVAIRHGRPAEHLRAVDHPALHKVLAGAMSPEAAALTENTPTEERRGP
jgi:xanthine dehydrogenase accessory factor